jgi:hypothetical protein
MLVLTTPEARPASCGRTPDIEIVVNDGNTSPAPAPSRTTTGSTSTR